MKDSLAAHLELVAGFRAPGAKERAAFLRRVGEHIEMVGDELIQVCHVESKLSIDRLRGERARTVNQLAMFADLIEEGSWVDARIDTAQPERKPIPKTDLRRMLVPLGPVAVFSASNFPFAFSVAGGDTASAFAAGCPVIVKGHPAHARTSVLVGDAIARAIADTGMPKAIFHLLTDSSIEAGTNLVTHPGIRAVGFTGSTRAGRALFNLAAARPDPIPVFAEMSSLNPVLIMPGALRERRAEIVNGLAGSVTLGVGQFCTKPGVVLGVQGPDWEEFSSALGGAFAKVEPAPMLYRGIEERLADSIRKTQAYVRVSQGAHLLRATAKEFRENHALQEEIFGPATLLVECADEAEVLQTIESLPGQLTATVHLTPNEEESSRAFLEAFTEKAGRVILNGYPTGVEVCASMQHGGPYPATTDSRFTSVGTAAIYRFARPVCYQNFAEKLLPLELQNVNKLRIWRQINGRFTQEDVAGK
ncbi:MAG TPA: aldehyde dehydrogenase (NADP(+)) [Chthoniobacterales bacterium]|nr:aldehyde dehydrogenase (NADP(+)) [Chthoniobacterales bacterium]